MTDQEIAVQFRIARHHSRAINSVLREATLTPAHHDVLNINIEILQSMLNEGTWTGVDITELEDSVAAGTTALNPDLVGLSTIITPEDVDNYYAGALISVDLINTLGSYPILTEDEFDRLERNVHHLEDILIDDYWIDHDLSVFRTAVADGNAKLSNPDGPSNPHNVVSIYATISGSAELFAAGAFPSADPVYSGWHYRNLGDGTKISWYLFTQDFTNTSATIYTLGEFRTIVLKQRNTHSTLTRLPHINYYTLPLGDGNDATAWYRSRITYELVNPDMTDVNQFDSFITWVGPDAPLIHTDLPAYQLNYTEAFSAGPQSSDEAVTAIAFSSDSSAAADSYDFILDEFSVITSDNRQLQINTISSP